MENFRIESKYLKLCNEFRDVIKCMTAVFYKPDYQKLLTCPLNKRLSQAFVSKHEAEPFKGSAELLKNSEKLLKHSAKLLRFPGKTKTSDESLCYNTAHTIPISHGRTTSFLLPPKYWDSCHV